FFFQAEDGIRDLYVTGVQTCALPISQRTPLKFPLQRWRRGQPKVQRGCCALRTLQQTPEQGLRPNHPSTRPARVARFAERTIGEIGRASCRERVEMWGGAGVGKEKDA